MKSEKEFESFVKKYNKNKDLEQLKVDIYGFIITNKISESRFTELMKSYCGELKEDLKTSMTEDLKQNLDGYFSLSFFREKEEKEQKEILEFFFKNYVLENVNIPKHYKDITEEQCEYLQRLFNTFQVMIIVDNLSKNHAIDRIRSMFAFDSEIASFIFDLHMKNKDELRILYILRRLNAIEDKTSDIFDIFKEIANDVASE